MWLPQPGSGKKWKPDPVGLWASEEQRLPRVYLPSLSPCSLRLRIASLKVAQAHWKIFSQLSVGRASLGSNHQWCLENCPWYLIDWSGIYGPFWACHWHGNRISWQSRIICSEKKVRESTIPSSHVLNGDPVRWEWNYEPQSRVFID